MVCAHDIDTPSESQFTDYFSDLISSHSWSAVKLDLYGKHPTSVGLR